MSEACCGPEPTSHPADGSHADAVPVEVVTLGPWWRDQTMRLPLTSGVLWLSGLLVEWAGNEALALVLHIGALATGAWTFVPGAVRRLWTGRGRSRLGVGLLMTIAAIGAVLLGHIGEAAALAFLFSIAETLEERAMHRARHGLSALLSLMPERARVSRLLGEVVIPASEVRRSDVLIVGAGERVATDGLVIEGESWLDVSAITGESVPADVGPGSTAPAGSVNGAGTLRIKATADGSDNSLTQIVRLIEQAHARKGERARLADRIARPLVPMVLVAAALIVAFGLLSGEPALWAERALVVLVAASPCALAIAVPVTVISSIGSASRFGVIIKSGEAFEQLGTIRRIVFDKTGTLTRNQPEVVEVRTAAGQEVSDVLRLAAALEFTSGHPFARAIIDAAASPDSAEGLQEHPGRGVRGEVGGRSVRIGSPRWVDPGALQSSADIMAQQGMSVIVVAVDGQSIGVVGIRDELKPEAAEAVATLVGQGVAVSMLTGDGSATALAVAEQAGIGDVHAEQLPIDKAEYVRRSSEVAPTAMVGDGVNDAPALASATVGIAMGATGTAAAVESADVAFTGTDLRLLPQALEHARRGRRIMTGNVALAVAIIVTLFPLALFGVLGLASVVLVHEVAEVVVIANGARAARTKRTVLVDIAHESHDLVAA